MFPFLTKSIAINCNRWISPSMSESEGIARRLQVKKVQGNIVIPPDKVRVQSTTVQYGKKAVDQIHPDKDESFISITCDSNMK